MRQIIKSDLSCYFRGKNAILITSSLSYSVVKRVICKVIRARNLILQTLLA